MTAFISQNKPSFAKRKTNILFLTTFLILSFFAVIFLFNFFEIKAITAFGERPISNEKLFEATQNFMRERNFIFSKKNLFLFNSDEFSQYLKNKFPKIKTVSVSKDWVKRWLVITLTERKPLLVWCGAEKDWSKNSTLESQINCFYVDDEGVAYELAPETLGSLVFKIESPQKTITLGQSVASADFVKSLFQLKNFLAEKNNIVIIDGTVKDSDVYLVTSQGWQLILPFDKFAAERLARIIINFIQQKLSVNDVSNLEYIDLRIPDRIFYKLKNQTN